MRYVDKRVKPQATIEPVAQAPSSPAVPDRYRNTAALQDQSLRTIERVLGHVAPELAGEVVRRTASDERYDAAARVGLDDGTALRQNLEDLTRELKNAEIRQRLDALKN